MPDIVDGTASEDIETLVIELGDVGVIEIDIPDVAPGPRGESGIVDVIFGSGNPVVQDGIKYGSIYIVKNT
jgi:hypothetical protein